MEECKELLQALKTNQENTNKLLQKLIILLGGE